MRGLAAMVGAALCACEPPPVVASADRAGEGARGAVRGHVVYQGKARGDVIVFIFDAANPPSPQGTGRPKSFTIVTREALFGAAPADSAGPFMAPYAFTQIPAGEWLVTALLDKDDCDSGAPDCRGSDWVPWFSATNEANKGDIAGGHADPATGQLLKVQLAAAEGRVDAEPVAGVNVLLSDTRAYPFDRPAFGARGSLRRATLEGSTIALVLDSAPLREGAVDQRSPVFLVRYVDADGNSVPDDANVDGLADLWPKIFVRKLAEDPQGLYLLDENDLDKDGKIDAQGPTYEHTDPALDGRPAVVVLAAGIIPSEIYPLLANSSGQPDVNRVVSMSSLPVVIKPQAYDAADPRRPALLRAVPPGHYAIIVQQYTGQTWRVPNETAPTTAVRAGFGLPGFVGQGFLVEVPGG